MVAAPQFWQNLLFGDVAVPHSWQNAGCPAFELEYVAWLCAGGGSGSRGIPSRWKLSGNAMGSAKSPDWMDSPLACTPLRPGEQ